MRVEEIIGSRLREAREAAEMTQEELGNELSAYLGKPWPRQAVSSAEKGHRSFTAAELLACSMALRVPVGDLFRPPAEEFDLTFPSGVTIRYEDLGRPDDVPEIAQLEASLGNFIKAAEQTSRDIRETVLMARFLHKDLPRAFNAVVKGQSAEPTEDHPQHPAT